ncbi:MAG: phosphatidate cytidylyltransferase [Cryomorphaceae bacterium]|jgi:phosphatidate cytidylyltransferase|nr:phosphatidate cytidylyltransferase [Cryomorphaceae bacterium]
MIGNLGQRMITGAVFGTLVIGSMLWNPYAFALVFSFFMVVGLWEFYRFFKTHQVVEVSSEIGIFIGIFIYILLVGISLEWFSVISLSLIFPLFFTLILNELWAKHAHPLLNISVLVFGIIYVVGPFYLSIDLHVRDTSTLPKVLGMFILIWTNDSFAYFSGRVFGKRKLFERISPKKTWEGTMGGIIFTLFFGFLIGTYINKGEVLFWMISALIIAPGAILGDLLESLFKRSLDIKDSGKILPGHGGVLDRFDAALFTIPFFYCWSIIYLYWK